MSSNQTVPAVSSSKSTLVPMTPEQEAQFKASPLYQKMYGKLNPLFVTSNMQYGAKPPTEITKQDVRYGQNGEFTKVRMFIHFLQIIYNLFRIFVRIILVMDLIPQKQEAMFYLILHFAITHTSQTQHYNFTKLKIVYYNLIVVDLL